jgi:omega-amidase
MKIGLCQIDCEVGDVSANLRTVSRMAEKGAGVGCDLVVFPELSDVGGDMEAALKHAKAWGSGSVARLSEIARRHGVAIVCGVTERDGENVYNTLAVVDGTGEVVGKYRKIHLFSAAPVFEHEYMTAGGEIVTVSLCGWRVGLMICYDVRFPELARSIALSGADLIVCPAAWPFPRVGHWTTLVATRAIENQVFVAGVNRVGVDGPLTFCGSSRLVDPWGIVMAGAGEMDETLVVAELDRSRIGQARSRIGVWEDRRPDVYSSGGS